MSDFQREAEDLKDPVAVFRSKGVEQLPKGIDFVIHLIRLSKHSHNPIRDGADLAAAKHSTDPGLPGIIKYYTSVNQ